MAPKQKPGLSKQDYATPKQFLEATKKLLKIKEFSFDFAASPENAVAHSFWTEQDNSLLQTPLQWKVACGDAWGNADGWGWLNPPFAQIRPWAKLCDETSKLGGKIAFLIPAAVGSNWFRDHVHGKAKVLMLNGRIPFMPDKPTWLYPKDCLLCLYGVPVGYEIWDWRKP